MPKPNDPITPDNAPNPPSFPARPADVDSTLPPDADLEERFNDFWEKNGTFIFGAIIAVAVIILGYQMYQWLTEISEQKTRDAYAAVESSEELIAFAEDNDGHALSGLAYMELANRRYAAEDYTQAAAHYQRAAEILKDSPTAGRARIGGAMAQLLGSNPQSGTQALRDILGDNSLLSGLRAEAGYNLALHLWRDDNFSSMEEVISQVEMLQESGLYGQQVMQLRQRIPVQAAQ